MQSDCEIAFKEWAAVCTALAEGRQVIILRKGGIHEGRAGFRVAHNEFWLYPTYLHEAADGLVADAGSLLQKALSEKPPEGTLRLSHYAVVSDVIEISDETKLMALAGQHVWSPEIVTMRFHYRQPGLFVLIVRIYQRPEPIVVPESPHFAGCRSWVDLPEALPTGGLEPIVDDETFDRLRRAALDAIESTSND